MTVDDSSGDIPPLGQTTAGETTATDNGDDDNEDNQTNDGANYFHYTVIKSIFTKDSKILRSCW